MNKSTTEGGLILIVIIVLGYGMYYVGKSFSYKFFYEDMVQETVIEMVKPEYLKDDVL